MAARAFMEQVRTVILQRRVRETQSRSEPAGAFQSLIAHLPVEKGYQAETRQSGSELDPSVMRNLKSRLGN